MIVIMVVLTILVIVGYVLSTRKTENAVLRLETKNRKTEVKLLEKIKLTHDTYKFKFALPRTTDLLGLKVGEHLRIHQVIKTKSEPEGEEIVRSYTPTSPVTQKGSFDLVIKVYRANEHPKFPEGGILSQWMEQLNEGDSIFISGPTGRLEYGGRGSFKYEDYNLKKTVTKQFDTVLLIGGGTGITPLYQIIQSCASDERDTTKLYLLYANKTEGDILIRKELESLNNRVKVSYTLDNPPQDWKGFSGFISKEMLQSAFPSPSPSSLVCLCGPPLMNKLVVGLLQEIGFQSFYQF